MPTKLSDLFQLRGSGGLALGAVAVALGSQLGMVALVLPTQAPPAHAAQSPNTEFPANLGPNEPSPSPVAADAHASVTTAAVDARGAAPVSGQAEPNATSAIDPPTPASDPEAPTTVAISEAGAEPVTPLSLPPDAWLRSALLATDLDQLPADDMVISTAVSAVERDEAIAEPVAGAPQQASPSRLAPVRAPELPQIPAEPASPTSPLAAAGPTAPTTEPASGAATSLGNRAVTPDPEQARAKAGTVADGAWMHDAPARAWVVQLMAARSRERIERLASAHQLPRVRTLMVESERSGRPWYSLIHGVYGSFEAAAAVGRELASRFGDGEPWIRRVQEVRSGAVALSSVGVAVDPVAAATSTALAGTD